MRDAILEFVFLKGAPGPQTSSAGVLAGELAGRLAQRATRFAGVTLRREKKSAISRDLADLAMIRVCEYARE